VSKANSNTVSLIGEALRSHTDIQLAIVFGSVAVGEQRYESDVDIAIDIGRPLTPQEKMALISQIAEKTGRPVDLIDLTTAGEPVLGEILKHGVRIVGSKSKYAALLSKHLLDAADFMPYRSRILRERRRAWTGK
jgi:predicted nucleotidyltransferase